MVSVSMAYHFEGGSNQVLDVFRVSQVELSMQSMLSQELVRRDLVRDVLDRVLVGLLGKAARLHDIRLAAEVRLDDDGAVGVDLDRAQYTLVAGRERAAKRWNQVSRYC